MDAARRDVSRVKVREQVAPEPDFRRRARGDYRWIGRRRLGALVSVQVGFHPWVVAASEKSPGAKTSRRREGGEAVNHGHCCGPRGLGLSLRRRAVVKSPAQRRWRARHNVHNGHNRLGQLVERVA
jgi:hypothetical protein